MNARTLSWLAAASAGAVVLWAAAASIAPQPPDAASICASHIKRVGLAVLLYAQDHAERYPPAAGWDALVAPYVIGPSRDDPWRCPSAQSVVGYGLNAAVAQVAWSRFNDTHSTVSMLECDASRRDATGGVRDLPRQPRHGGADMTGYADGHVAAVPRSDAAKLRWRP